MGSIKALSVLDGRYARLTETLQDVFSEFGLIRFRVLVEIEWLHFILGDLKLAQADPGDLSRLGEILDGFGETGAMRVKEIEAVTNHDVKAVEYFIKERMEAMGLGGLKEWVHFACTSDDINNISYALMLQRGRSLLLLLLSSLTEALEAKASEYRAVPMMSRTHGQPASPTTVGKEFVNFAWRLSSEIRVLESIGVQAKINGATGNYNAHHFAFPEIDWIDASQRFLAGRLGLEPILFTTQINPNFSLSSILHSLVRSAAVVIDLDRDMWGYISLGYFRQRLNKGETGSSTMPHKVNPIDFENSEGNMGLAIAMMEHPAVKLQKSRFQRDLTDSTVLRSLGSAFGYYLIGIRSCLKGIGKIELDGNRLAEDLEANPELLAEPFQTAMRIFGEPNPYERLKDLTRGRRIEKADLDRFVDGLDRVPGAFKARMKALTAGEYTGLAERLVERYFSLKPKG
jgi:adenylosuccinate lyase